MIFLYLVLSIVLGAITTWFYSKTGSPPRETFFTTVWIVNGLLFFISTIIYSVIFSIIHFILTGA